VDLLEALYGVGSEPILYFGGSTLGRVVQVKKVKNRLLGRGYLMMDYSLSLVCYRSADPYTEDTLPTIAVYIRKSIFYFINTNHK